MSWFGESLFREFPGSFSELVTLQSEKCWKKGGWRVAELPLCTTGCWLTFWNWNHHTTVETIVPKSWRLIWYRLVKNHGKSVFSISVFNPCGLKPTVFQFWLVYFQGSTWKKKQGKASLKVMYLRMWSQFRSAHLSKQNQNECISSSSGRRTNQKLCSCLAFLAELACKAELSFGRKTLLLFGSSSNSFSAFKVTWC